MTLPIRHPALNFATRRDDITHWPRVCGNIHEVVGHCISGGTSIVERYKNLSGDSGVVQYQLREGAILVQFLNGSMYEYTNESAGAEAISTMHQLAAAGRGLSSFISTNVRERYWRRIR